MVLRVRWRQGLPADELDALGVHRHREIHHLIGLKVGSGWVRQRISWRRVPAFPLLWPLSPRCHRPAAPPPSIFLLGLRMASVMKRVVENSGDAQIVFAAILKIARNVLREGRILFAQDVTTVLQPQNNRSQVLRKTRRHASSTTHEELVHLAAAGSGRPPIAAAGKPDLPARPSPAKASSAAPDGSDHVAGHKPRQRCEHSLPIRDARRRPPIRLAATRAAHP